MHLHTSHPNTPTIRLSASPPIHAGARPGVRAVGQGGPAAAEEAEHRGQGAEHAGDDAEEAARAAGAAGQPRCVRPLPWGLRNVSWSLGALTLQLRSAFPFRIG